LDPDLSERLIAAEEAIYADASNPQVNWNVKDLVAHFTAAGFTQVQSKVESLQSQRLIELRQLNHWFSPGGEKRHTYANFLAQALDQDELQQVRKLFDHCLANHTVTWTTSQVFLVAKFGESTVSTTS
jgi:putative ATPase